MELYLLVQFKGVMFGRRDYFVFTIFREGAGRHGVTGWDNVIVMPEWPTVI